jgi:hypothetical protein
MCGIVGIGFLGSLSRNEEKTRQEIAQYFLTELLVETQARGEDATGVSVVFDNGNYIGLKSGISAVDFITKKNEEEKDKTFTGLMNTWTSLLKGKNPTDAKIAIAHCRKSSVGNSYDNTNNHPIHIDPIIGIHNGTLTNDSVIFDKLGCGRDGKVDSEAIIRLAYKYTDGGKDPFDIDMMNEIGSRLDGSFTTLIANSNNPYQIGFIREDRPMEVCLVKKLNMLIIASDLSYIKKTLFRYMRISEIFPEMFKSINPNWPLLRSSDVTYKTIPNSEVGIFDLTTVTDADKNAVSDFMVRANLKKTIEPWKSDKVGFIANRNYNSHVNNNVNRQTTTTTANQSQKDKNQTTIPAKVVDDKNENDNKDRIVGRLWIDSLKKYEDVTAKEVGEVVDTDKCIELVVAKEADKATHFLTETSFNLSESLLKEVPVLERHIPGPHDEQKSTDSKDSKNDTSINVSPGSTNFPVVSVDMLSDPIALDFTSKYKKSMKHFESRVEVAEALGFDSEHVIENLGVIPLMNRARKEFLKEGYYDGFIMGRNYNNTDGLVSKKGKKRDELIGTYKILTNLLASVIKESSDENYVGSAEDYISSIIHKQNISVSKDNLDRVIEISNLKSNELMPLVYKHLAKDK